MDISAQEKSRARARALAPKRPRRNPPIARLAVERCRWRSGGSLGSIRERHRRAARDAIVNATRD